MGYFKYNLHIFAVQNNIIYRLFHLAVLEISMKPRKVFRIHGRNSKSKLISTVRIWEENLLTVFEIFHISGELIKQRVHCDKLQG